VEECGLLSQKAEADFGLLVVRGEFEVAGSVSNLLQSEGPMPWLILVVAGLLEVGWAVGLKYTDGLTKPWPTVATAVILLASVGLLAVAVRDLPLGTAYAVWTGIGTVGTVIVGIVLFAESTSVLRLVCVAAIISGILGLKLVSPP
jgi:quaternary ammonium compound-resistance protein SugE